MNDSRLSGSYGCGVMTEPVTLRRGHARWLLRDVAKYLVEYKR